MSEDDRRAGPPHSRFDALVQEYARLIRGVVSRVAGPHAARLAEDAEQEILLALWKQLRQGRDIAFPSSYLYRAAVRETVRLVRALRRGQGVPLDEVAEPVAAGTPHDDVAREADAQRVRAALDALAIDRRRAVEAHLAGLSADEVMAVTGWSYNRTRNLTSRGMADLRRQLHD